MSSSRVAVVRRTTEALSAFTCQVGAEKLDTARGQDASDEPDPAPRTDEVDALLQQARREIAETGQVSAATADALSGAVRSLSYAELHDLIVGQGGAGASDN